MTIGIKGVSLKTACKTACRSILSVPGHVQKMHPKAHDSAADNVMFDLEDSVPMDQKENARKQVVQSLLAMDWQHKTVTVRINALDTPFAYRDLIDIVEEAGHLLDAVVIPKVDHPGDIHFVHRLLNGIEMDRQPSAHVAIEASIESARGLERVSDIARASKRLVSLVFGVADYSASVGARLVSVSGHGEAETETYPGHRWHFPLSRIVMAAKANGLSAIDATYGNFKDPEGLRIAAVMSNALGCDGKWVIHPAQIDIVNDVFSPTPEDIERARAVMTAHQSAVENGRGAVSVDGRMVDNATIRLARQLYEQARRLGLIDQ
jgi:malyl-CoA/(S)-citramalyl-CoA lyase